MLAFAQDMMASFADQKDGPVQIVSLVSSLTDLAERIEVVNKSKKAVIEFQVGWFTASPAGVLGQAGSGYGRVFSSGRSGPDARS
jgi:hypothetical protein